MMISPALPLTQPPTSLPLFFIATHSHPPAFLHSVPGKLFSSHALIPLAPFCLAKSFSLLVQASSLLGSLPSPSPRPLKMTLLWAHRAPCASFFKPLLHHICNYLHVRLLELGHHLGKECCVLFITIFPALSTAGHIVVVQ